MTPVFEPQEAIIAWAGRQLGVNFHQPCYAIGVVNNAGEPVGAAVFNDFADRNIEVTMVGPGAFSRSIARVMAEFAFNANNVSRLTVRTRAKNKKLAALIEKTGWKREGRLRRWYGDDDAIVFGMLRKECRFLK